MITDAQRRKLRTLAEQARPTIELGGSRIGARKIIDISIAIDRYELVKIVLQSNQK